MDLNQLREILDLVRAHELSEFEVEQDGLKLKIRRNAAGVPVVAMPALAPANSSGPAAAPTAVAAAASLAAAASGDAADVDLELAVVKSPIVGTFYRSPEPSAPPCVEIGAQVEKRQVLGVLEATKVVNEID